MFSDTIAAIATAPGRGAISLIRMSGRDAFRIAAAVLHPFSHVAGREVFLARATHPESGEELDRVVCTAYGHPASYTGEDVVEVSTHGGLLVPVTVLEALFAAGARQARPGEFTMRAVTNGKMDLLQAEAVADLIEATARAQRRAALSQLDRGLSHRIEGLRKRAIELEALMSYDIDFPEEDDGPVAPDRIRRSAVALLGEIDGLVNTSSDGETLRRGALAVIAGKPNSGKSSLFNALVGYERAIVTDVAGTTRDAIETPVSCDGFPFRLVDTAGIRESDDTVERMGVAVSRKYVDAADVVLLCSEAGRELDEAETLFASRMNTPVIVVRTKSDLAAESASGGKGISVSSVTGTGLAELRRTLAATAFSHQVSGADIEPGLTRARHRTALTRAQAELRDFVAAFDDGVDGVVAAVHIRAAVGALEELVGVVTTEDVLDAVFAEFCVGK